MTRSGVLGIFMTVAHLGTAGVGPVLAQSADTMPNFELREHQGPAGPLAYRLHLPGGWTAPHRLLVVLHGCTQDADDVARGTGFNDLAETGGFAVLYPQQSAAGHPQRCWSWYDRSQQEPGGSEVRNLTSLVRSVMADLQVAPGQVHLIGISAGGAMAGILAVTHPELFGGVAMHSTPAYGAAGDVTEALAAMQQGATALPDPGDPRLAAVVGAQRPEKVLVVHGSDDAVVRPVNGVQTAAQWVAILSARLGAPLAEAAEETAEDGGRTVHRRSWRDATGRTRVVHLAVQGLGHAWSGGDASGSYADPTGPSASRHMAEFLGLLP